MPRRNPPAKWVLPSTVDPAGRKCIKIEVPDEPAHIAAFRGALLALASAYNWADDTAHTAKDVALVWRAILDNSFDWGCDGLPTEIRVDDICTLSWSYDDWVTFDSYDPSSCITANIDNYVPSLIQQAIQDAIDSGQIATPGAEGGDTGVPQNSCNTYHVRLMGNQQWHCPVTIASGYTVTISNLTGAWSDNGTAYWCPDGQVYVLGACTPTGMRHDDGDPLFVGAYHMALVGHIGPVYVNPIDAPFTVPSGYGQSDFYLQANDGTLADNTGAIEFDIEICNDSWCQFVDLAGTLPSWLSVLYGTQTANGIEGTTGNGYRPDTEGNAYGTRTGLTYTFPDDCFVSDIFATVEFGAANAQSNIRGVRNKAPWSNTYVNLGAGYTGLHTYHTTPNHALTTGQTFQQIFGAGWAGSAFSPYCTIVIKSVMLRGTGTSPFGANNC